MTTVGYLPVDLKHTQRLSFVSMTTVGYVSDRLVIGNDIVIVSRLKSLYCLNCINQAFNSMTASAIFVFYPLGSKLTI